MGSAQCCKKNVQDEGVQELVILEDPNQQTAKLSDLQQEKHSYKKTEECGTPAFPELRSQQSKRSEQCQSLKEIQFVGQVDRDEQILKSTCTLGRKKQKNDSPIVAFEAKNSLKSFDSNRLKKLQSVPEKQLNLKNISSPRDEDSFMQDSQRCGQPDEKSAKSILKQEMKYSRFRNQQNQGDSTFRKVQFNLE
ncbi:unnamed protein product (macronuclear) [Paramecium tetraurelia]|uniref:Shugoshin C-terminal domain-containing protein n=1 Tax=Paramecium tetraurelia TaxID=5888 RepID=A0BCU0_PARTE|nr:uncharacterized protein GSPATT00004451001 [Paramecium tetraurelia]CAK56357.1 unnamed protein product [Paramecium tetraurelia]|eukprot:XP_001423755.1 hypothetical protein (macronuclear) [Paramecium tetraurelia strain d4-2]